jgi:hypothetical protein
MTAKKKITEKGVLDSEIRNLMTPVAIEELKILSPTMQQFLLRWQDHRDIILGDQLKEELKEFLGDIYIKDNENLCRDVTASVCSQMEEFLTNINTRLAELSKGQEAIASDIGHIKDDILDIKKRLKTDENAIIELWNAIRPLQRYASVGWTIIRNLITAVIAAGVAVVSIIQIHAHLK